MRAKPIRVLIVDDSALVRRSLSEVLEDGSGQFEVMGAATDPFHAVRLLREEAPDVILLDIEMPKMDGVTFLRKLMRQHPIPTIICSSLAKQAAPITVAALQAGAVDVITKPDLSTREFFLQAQERIHHAVRAAAHARVRKPLSLAPPAIAKKSLTQLSQTTNRVIAIGASTGGPDAVLQVLLGFDAHTPAIVITQHMPAGFTAAFAHRLGEQTQLHVREAKDGDQLLMGQALVAPGDHHLKVERSGARYVARVVKTAPVNRHRPSVDVLFDSVAECAKSSAIGVLLTGMGADGAQGLLHLRNSGAHTIAQDEASSVVFGMPQEGIKCGGAESVLPLSRISAQVRGWLDGSLRTERASQSRIKSQDPAANRKTLPPRTRNP